MWANVGQLIVWAVGGWCMATEGDGGSVEKTSREYTAEEENLLRIISRNNPGAALPHRCIRTTWTDRNMHLGY